MRVQGYLHLLILAILLCLISCTDNQNSTESTSQEVIKTPDSTSKSLLPDTGSMDVNIKHEKKPISVFPLGTFKSFPHIVKSLFGNGSNKEEVRRVMNNPELIDDTKPNDEIWYYGPIEIHFKYGIVNDVVNPQKCIQYVGMGDLLISSDPIEKKFGQFLLERASTISKFQ